MKKCDLLFQLRSALTCNALLLHFYSLQYLSMGDALVIASATPIVVTILARIFLAEKCGLVTIFASIFTLVGVVIINKPPLLTGNDSFDRQTLASQKNITICKYFSQKMRRILKFHLKFSRSSKFCLLWRIF